jgi:hypothetical protein
VIAAQTFLIQMQETCLAIFLIIKRQHSHLADVSLALEQWEKIHRLNFSYMFLMVCGGCLDLFRHIYIYIEDWCLMKYPCF